MAAYFIGDNMAQLFLFAMGSIQGKTVETFEEPNVGRTYRVTLNMELWQSFFIYFIVMLIGSLAFVFLQLTATKTRTADVEESTNEQMKNDADDDDNGDDSPIERIILYFISFFASFVILGSKFLNKWYHFKSSNMAIAYLKLGVNGLTLR